MIDDVRRLVVARANGRCEYCRLPEAGVMRGAFQLEHIRARQHGGLTSLENLAWSCRRCNLFKGPNLSAYDPGTDRLVRLFNPRLDRWEEHFQAAGPIVVGVTPEGRATMALLRFNDDLRVQLRGELSD